MFCLYFLSYPLTKTMTYLVYFRMMFLPQRDDLPRIFGAEQSGWFGHLPGGGSRGGHQWAPQLKRSSTVPLVDR